VSVPFALSIHNFVDKIGAYCGFGAIIGLAVLILLFFSHAREIANLRSRLGEAQERIVALEGRVMQLIRAPAPVQRTAPGPVQPTQPPVAPARAPMGTAAASVRRVPDGQPPQAPLAPAAPAGTGAPALASATSMVAAADSRARRSGAPRRGGEAPGPAPSATSVARAGEDTVLVPAGAATAAGAPGVGNGVGRAAAAAATPPPTRTRPPLPAGGRGPAGRAMPPRVQMREGQQIPAPAGRRAAAPPPSLQEPPPNRSVRRRVLSGLAGLVVVGAVVVALLVVTNNGGTTKSNVHHPGAGSASHSQGGKKHRVPVVKHGSVTVAVLNGTAVSGLAGDVSSALTKKGFRQGPVTNAAVETQARTQVAYVANNVREAQAVAKSLGLPFSTVHKADETTIQSCETPVTGTTTSSGSCQANVIVTVGSDKASLASSGTSTSA
jgi:hypothetical protein